MTGLRKLFTAYFTRKWFFSCMDSRMASQHVLLFELFRAYFAWMSCYFLDPCVGAQMPSQSVFCANCFLHTSHVCCFSPVWINLCSFKWADCLNCFLHISHENGLSQCESACVVLVILFVITLYYIFDTGRVSHPCERACGPWNCDY